MGTGAKNHSYTPSGDHKHRGSSGGHPSGSDYSGKQMNNAANAKNTAKSISE